jgi:hypothetical protein
MTASLPNHIPLVGKNKTPVKNSVEKVKEEDDENVAVEMSSNMKKTQPLSQNNMTGSKENGSITSSSRFCSKVTTLQVNSKMTLQPTMQMSKLTANKNEPKHLGPQPIIKSSHSRNMSGNSQSMMNIPSSQNFNQPEPPGFPCKTESKSVNKNLHHG